MKTIVDAAALTDIGATVTNPLPRQRRRRPRNHRTRGRAGPVDLPVDCNGR